MTFEEWWKSTDTAKQFFDMPSPSQMDVIRGAFEAGQSNPKVHDFIPVHRWVSAGAEEQYNQLSQLCAEAADGHKHAFEAETKHFRDRMVSLAMRFRVVGGVMPVTTRGFEISEEMAEKRIADIPKYLLDP